MIFIDSMYGENDCALMFSTAGNRKKQKYDQRAQMVPDAMKHVNEKAVRNSFKTCGLNFLGDGEIVRGYEFMGHLTHAFVKYF